MNPDAAIYQLRAIRHYYTDRLILDLPALDIERGEILALVGPSGSGKSTLLRLLQFLEVPTQGSITFAGQTITGPAELKVRRRIATVFQRPMLLDRSVYDNIAFGLRLRGQRESESHIAAVLDKIGLSQYERAKARTLSGGEAQRVALARAIILHPEALLLDEPTANLDPYNVGLIEALVHDHGNTTIVLVTHNVFQARRLADRVGLLMSGRLIELLPTEQFFTAPTDSRTRAFISGEMVY